MKTVFKSHELSHLWAHQLQESGRCASHMRFDGKSFYSYNTEIAHHRTEGEARLSAKRHEL